MHGLALHIVPYPVEVNWSHPHTIRNNGSNHFTRVSIIISFLWDFVTNLGSPPESNVILKMINTSRFLPYNHKIINTSNIFDGHLSTTEDVIWALNNTYPIFVIMGCPIRGHRTLSGTKEKTLFWHLESREWLWHESPSKNKKIPFRCGKSCSRHYGYGLNKVATVSVSKCKKVSDNIVTAPVLSSSFNGLMNLL
jgi:hypothetical protein